MKIALLADWHAYVDELASMYIAEWEPYYGPAGPGDAERDLGACLNRDRIPLALVALDASGRPIGTAALKARSLPGHDNPGPWLAALVVRPEARGKGVASRLVSAIEAEARRLGYAFIYTAMSDAQSRLVKGWDQIEDGFATLREPVAVFRKKLDPA